MYYNYGIYYISYDLNCGLCRYLNNTHKYKLLNGTECLNEIIEGSENYISRFYLLVCKRGYILNDNKCIPHCYERCKICSEFSMDIFNQKCIECKEGYSLENGNCIKKINNINFDSMTFGEFRNFFIDNNISLYVNSSNIINGSDFIASISFSNDTIVNNQIRFLTSSINIEICPQLIFQYNISDNDSLIILITQIKNNESNNNEKNLGIKILLNIFDLSGRKLDLSICGENIKIIHDLDGFQVINITSAKNFANQGIDVFNASDSYFNDLCRPYDDENNKDIIIKDRRNDIYQNATFCQDECLYKSIDFGKVTVNCLCNTNSIQVIYNNFTDENKTIKEEQNELLNFKTLRKTFTSNLYVFNFDIMHCYNLILDLNKLIRNSGFYFSLITFLTQIILFFIFLYKKLRPIKTFMLNRKSNNKSEINIISNLNNNNNNEIFKKKKNMISNSSVFKSDIHSKNKRIIKTKNNKSNSKKQLTKNSRNILTYGNNSNITNYKEGSENQLKSENKRQNEVLSSAIILMNENDLKEMDYKDSIKKDKRSFLRMFWSFFVYSQINLGTFCTENYLNLFVIKLSFLIYRFEMIFFLNAFFYSDEYISDAYHNNGILKFVSGLPKSIYSAVLSSLITIILKMLSNSEDDLSILMKKKYSDKIYKKKVENKLNKLRNKLIAYYFLLFLLNILFLYFTSIFCAVYRYSQKYLYY